MLAAATDEEHLLAGMRVVRLRENSLVAADGPAIGPRKGESACSSLDRRDSNAEPTILQR